MAHPSREALLVLKRILAKEPLWPQSQLWAWEIPKPYCEYRYIFGFQSADYSRFTPVFEVYAEWEGEALAIKPYRYHNHPQMDALDPHNPFVVTRVDMTEVMP